MSLNMQKGYEELSKHHGHKFECVAFSGGVSLRCVTCGTTILDFDKPAETVTIKRVRPMAELSLDEQETRRQEVEDHAKSKSDPHDRAWGYDYGHDY